MLELISIHINKTAGKSFRNILAQNYGRDLFCVNVDNSEKQHRSLSCKSFELVGLIPSTARALHGHFPAKDIVDIANGVPVIAWFRSPVERVISNYFHDLNNGYTKLNITDYVLQDSNINKISRMLDGISLNNLVIGFQETFNQDVKRIGKMFGWNNLSAPMINVGKKNSVSSNTRELIENLNREDIGLYNASLMGSLSGRAGPV